MSTLTSLLARDHKIPVRKIEKAIQRQVIAGGGLDTVLLEADALPENEMAAYCAAVHGLTPATRAECMDVGRDVVRAVPTEVAIRHQLIPLSFEGHQLVVAVSRPLASEVDEQIGFLLGVRVQQRIAPEVRIAAAMHLHYGMEMVPRLGRLMRRLENKDAGSAMLVAPLEDHGRATRELGNPAPKPPSEPRTKRRFRRQVTEPGIPAVGVARTITLDEMTPPVTPSQASSLPPPPRVPTIEPVVPQAPDEPETVMAPREAARRLAKLSTPPGPTRISEPQGARLRKHRGPLTASHAVELLKAADGRDEILEIAFAFFRQFFDASAVFVTNDGEAEGLEIVGPGTNANRFERLGVPLDEPSALRRAFEGRFPLVVEFAGDGQDERSCEAMKRVGQGPALLLPIAIRSRVVLIFYGDRSGETFGLSDVPEPTAFAVHVSEALTQLILRKKMRPSRRSAPDLIAAPKAPSEAPEGALADDESHVRWSDPPPPAPKAAWHRSNPLHTLGVRGSAPPPPSVGERPNVTPPGESSDQIPVSTKASVADSQSPIRQPRPGRQPLTKPVDSDLLPPQHEVLNAATSIAQPAWSTDDLPVRKPSAGTYAQQGGASDTVQLVKDESWRDEAFDAHAAPTVSAARPMKPSRPEMPTVSAKRSSSDSHVAVETADQDGSAPETGDDFPELTVGLTAESKPPIVGLDHHEAVTVDERRPRFTHDASDDASDDASGDASGDASDDASDADVDERSKRESAAPMPLVSTIRRPRSIEADSLHTDVVTGAEDIAPVPPATDEEPVRPRIDTRPDTPSVIVEMGDNVEATVAELRYAGPDAPDAVIHGVMQHGEAALPVLVREFPGPLFFDRRRPHRRLPRGRDLSALARAITAFGDLAVPYVISLLGRERPDDRFYAVLLSSEFSHSRLVPAIGGLIFDEDRGVATLALDVLRTLQPFAAELETLFERLRSEARIPRGSIEHRRIAIAAIGELRDVGALKLLIAFLDKDPELGPTARGALRCITQQDFGDNIGKWNSWVAAHGFEHRVQWLIAALGHADETIRRSASEELKELSREYFGYHPSLPKKERDVIQRKYLRWWVSKGEAIWT